jgi:4-amino-4-deoxy-L-arabinose transferase-like glycosyltransferase
VLGVGIGEPTGVTGKDEYYLSLRTPMCMAEQDVWWVPCLDGEPRLKKPPMIYWLARASYEVFGVSLTSARLVAVLLAAAMVLGIALIALELGRTLSAALLSGVTALSFLSLFVGGRMLELDVPVAAFSTLGFYALLRWYRGAGWAAVVAAAGLLAGGFLTKGPIVFVVAGAGALALLVLERDARRFLLAHRHQAVVLILLFAAAALPWFVHVAQTHPEAGARELVTELSDRQFLKISAVPLYGLQLLALPWSFVLLGRLYRLRDMDAAARRRAGFTALWLGLTLLPFFFIKSFERYLFGSLTPLALLLADAFAAWDPLLKWMSRLALVLLLPVVSLVAGLALLLGGTTPLLALMLPSLAWFTYQWWRGSRPELMAVSAVLLWTCTLGIAYPQLGINRIPAEILAAARGRPVALLHGPQPAMLAPLLGRSLVHLDERWRLPPEWRRDCGGFLLFAEEDQRGRALDGLGKAGYRVTDRREFGIFSARVNWANMARRGLSKEAAIEALLRGDVEAVKPRVIMFTAVAAACPGE